jgi:nitrous oxidase accessory protein NosD
MPRFPLAGRSPTRGQSSGSGSFLRPSSVSMPIRPRTPLHLVRAAIVLAAAAAALSACGEVAPRASAPIRPARAHPCDRYASPRGSDHPGRGSRRRPYRTLGRLVRSLRTGGTGCLLKGTYVHRNPLSIRRPGVTLRSAGRARATIDGAVWIEPSARGARLTRLALTAHDPTFDIPLKIQADDVRVTRSSITNAVSSICILLGSDRTASRTLIERNRISRCGKEGKYDHLLYLHSTRGAVIRWNVLTGDTGGWAVHLYPDADGTLVEHNVIDGNAGGVIFAGSGSGDTSDGNVVRNNAITFSGPRWNLESSWSGGSPGVNNTATHNCLFSLGPGSPGGIASTEGFVESDNVVLGGSPYVNRDGGDYRFLPGSPCASLVGHVPPRARR